MKFRKTHVYILAAALLVSLLGSLYHVKNLEEPDSKGMLFVTLGINRANLTSEVSSYEIMRASEHFADVILGWTLDPTFKEEVNGLAGYEVSVNGQKQEKQNMIFYISADSDKFDNQAGVAVETALRSRLEEFNSNTNSSFVFGLTRFSNLESYVDQTRIVVGVVLLTLVITFSLILAFEYAKANWGRSSSAS